jgi:hypothetical protein
VAAFSGAGGAGGFIFASFSLERAVRGPHLGPAQRASSAKPDVSITLDGKLDEPVWRETPTVQLVQQFPKPGAATLYQTEARVIVTVDRIYFGFRFTNPDTGHISIHTMRRDETMGRGEATKTDDTVSIILDTYGDRRTEYFFQINSADTRTGGLISNQPIAERKSIFWFSDVSSWWQDSASRVVSF